MQRWDTRVLLQHRGAEDDQSNRLGAQDVRGRTHIVLYVLADDPSRHVQHSEDVATRIGVGRMRSQPLLGADGQWTSKLVAQPGDSWKRDRMFMPPQ